MSEDGRVVEDAMASLAETPGPSPASAPSAVPSPTFGRKRVDSVRFIEPGAGRPDYLYLQNIDRALNFGDLACFFLAGAFVSFWMLGAGAAPLTTAFALGLATFVFSRVSISSKVYATAAHKVHPRLLRRLAQALIVTFAIVMATTFAFAMEAVYSRSFLLAWFVAAASLILTFRLCVAALVRLAIANGRLRRRVAIYGGDAQGVAVIDHLGQSDDVHYSLVGYYDDRFQRVPPQIKGYERRGGLEELEAAVRAGHVDEVIVALPLSAVERLSQIMERLSRYHVTVLFAPDLAMWRFFDRPFETINGAPMLRALEAPIEGWEGVAKFLEDRVLSALLFVLVSPILAAAALAIRLDSPGPVFFKQPRRGWNGGIFTIYKFRTMRTDMADMDGDVQTTKTDPRVTRVGAFLRRTSIDELPQLINVLKGDMSLVGPRPHALGTKAEGKPFEEAVADYMRRYKVKPGITGWAQVNGWRGETDTNRKLFVRVKYDIEYIENWTIWFDLYILTITPLALIFRSQNAY
ncbi:MAG: undecaprenyl-phosphate glucose phosphotransferase [Pseudomonadota bacterium]